MCTESVKLVLNNYYITMYLTKLIKMTSLKDIEGLGCFGDCESQSIQDYVFREGNAVLDESSNVTMTKDLERKYRALFGCNLTVCTALYMLLKKHSGLSNLQPKHLFWTLVFLKTYINEIHLAKFAKASANTVRKWIWDVTHEIEALSEFVVSKNFRFR